MDDVQWPDHPRIFELNAWTTLDALSRKHGEEITLKNIPLDELEGGGNHFDAIWLMGVWERSPASRAIALKHPDLQVEFHRALGDYEPEDIVGSPFSVRQYEVDPRLGGPEGLARIRDELHAKELLLILDFVPNHVAIDHPWTRERPNCLLPGTPRELEARPHDFFKVDDRIYAHGRDPYFLPWTDTAQINAFSREARQEISDILRDLAGRCDGVRCDMAMLVTNQVFQRTWGERGGFPPETEFWEEIIPAVKNSNPNFRFIAEVYWNMEWDLQRMGFDFCYDKRLYDRLLHERADIVRGHLQAEWDYASKLVRFVENHDETRALEAFGLEKSKAAAVIALTLPGARLIHEGQPQGFRLRVPVQLGRSPEEEGTPEISTFYARLLDVLPSGELTRGSWRLCRSESVGGGNQTHINLIAHLWEYVSQRRLIVVNYSGQPAQGQIWIPGMEFGAGFWEFKDLLRLPSPEYVYSAKDLDIYGLYVDLPPWESHVFDVISRD